MALNHGTYEQFGKMNLGTSLPDVRNDDSTFRNLMPLINIFLCQHMGNACQVNNQFKNRTSSISRKGLQIGAIGLHL